MTNHYNLVLQGDEKDNTLNAHEQSNGGGFDYYTIVHGNGGNDRLSVDYYLYLRYKKGVELYGDDGNDRISDTENSLFMGNTNDTLSGGTGDDVIASRAGKDVIDGGDGSDTLQTGGDFSRLTVTGVEHLYATGQLQITGSDLAMFASVEFNRGASVALNDATTLHADNFIGNVYLIGSAENDILDLSGSTANLTITGGNGDDSLLSGSGRAELNGGSGDDDIIGGTGNDRLNGGNGDDTVIGGDGNDLIIAEIGNDWVKGGDGNDKISGETIYDNSNYPIRSTGDKMFDGGAGDDLFENVHNLTDFDVTLIGGKGEDTLEFHGDASNLNVSGIETLVFTDKVSRPHFDLSQPLKASGEFLESFRHVVDGSYDPSVTTPMIQLTSADDFHWRDAQSKLSGEISGTTHADAIDMSNAAKYWTISGGNGDDVLTAGIGAEFYAGDGDDKVVGGSGGDNVFAGRGDDVINGRGGKDVLEGDQGSDTFVFQSNSGEDYIYNFGLSGADKDKIDLSAVKSVGGYADLIEHHVHEKFNGLFLEFSDKDRLWLDGFSKEMLDSSMFVF